MSICFPKHTPEGKLLIEKVGEVEATRDWMENGYTVRTPNQVLEKLANRGKVVPQNPLKEYQEEAAARILGKTEGLKKSQELKQEYDNRVRKALIDFMKKFNIKIVENGDSLMDGFAKNLKYGDPSAAFDLLQKYLLFRSNVTQKDFLLQSANVLYSFIGKKSKLGIELWKNIDKWAKYDLVYNKFANADVVTSEDIEYSRPGFNVYAHKQAIIHLIAEALEVGIDSNHIGEKRKNPDIDKKYFEQLGYWDKYEMNFFKRMYNKIMNWFLEFFQGAAVNTKMSEMELKDMVLDIVDDVYKKEYSKFIRSYEEVEPGVFKTLSGELLEQKYYDQTLDKDPFAKSIVQRLFDNPFLGFYLSGSLTLRKYGRVLRSISEDLHDIDGVIDLNTFRQEPTALAFVNWIDRRGLPLMRASREDPTKARKFFKEVKPLLEKQNWYQNVQQMYPSWTLTACFIGRDHAKGESITVTGYVEHPTETEVVTKAEKGYTDSDIGLVKPKRYVIDFFLRTKEGNYPEKFDNYWKDWKQIFEAKINMGRAKDISDLIYFIPDKEDIYKFTNKGFRYYTFPMDTTAAEMGQIAPGENSFAAGISYKENSNYSILDNEPSYYKDLKDLTESPSALNGFLNAIPFQLSPADTQKARGSEFMKKFVDRLSERTGISYAFISPEQAKALTANTQKPWTPANPAFAFGGVVYFVGDSINTTIAFHEFSHPIIDAVFESNPKLFESLYKELKATNEGMALIDMMTLDGFYGGDETNPEFRKEALVRAISEKANSNYINKKSSEGFAGWVKNIMYHIKQLLRKAFGKIKIEKLSPNTTIDEMAEMLSNDTFQIETPIVKESDIVEYYKYLNDKMLTDLYDSGNAIPKVLTTLYEGIQTPLRDAIDNEDWEYVLNLMKDDLDVDNQNQVKRIRSDIKNHVDEIKKYGENKIVEVEQLNKQAEALATSMGRLHYVLGNFVNDMQRMSARSTELLGKDKLTTDEARELKNMLVRSTYINNVASYWKKFYTVKTDDNKTGGIRLFTDTHPESSPWRQLAIQTAARIDKITELYKPVLIAGNKAWLTATLLPMAESIDAKYQEQIKKAEAQGDKKNVARLKAEYEKQKLTPQRIEEMLRGQWEDANPFNIFLESYMYSADDVVGGFTVWLSNHLTDIENNTIHRYQSFMQEVMPIIKELGYNPNQIDQIMRWIARDDDDGFTDADGNWIENKVWRLKSAHKNFYRDLKKFQHDIDAASKESIKSGDKTKYNALVEEEKEWKRKFFYREFKDEVYDIDKIFDETYTDDQGNVVPIGQMTRERRDEILNQIKVLENSYQDEEERVKKITERDGLWREYNQLCSLKDEKDQDKPVGSISHRMAVIMQRYREASRKYYQWNLKLDKFQQKYEQYATEMAAKTSNKEEFEAAMQEWWDANTVVAVTPEFHERTSKILKQIIDIYKQASGKSTEALEMSTLYKELSEILYNYRDDNGQPNGKDIGARSRVRIKEITERINDLREQMNTNLTLEEKERFEYYEDLFQTGQYDSFTNEEKKDFDELTAKLQAPSRDGLTAAQRVNLSTLYRQLNVYRSKQATSYYLEVVNSFFLDEELLKKFPQFRLFDKLGGTEGVINKKTAEWMLSVYAHDEKDVTIMKDGKPVLLIDKVMEENPEFASWFVKNHIKVKKWDPNTKTKQEAWQRLPQWSVSRPNSSHNLVHTTVRDINGNTLTLPGKPSLRYFDRDVKGLTNLQQHELDKLRSKKELGKETPEDNKRIAELTKIESEGYKTRKVLGETVDSRGNWLPKTVAEGAPDERYIDTEYLAMRYGSERDQKIYQLTEAFKRHYLSAQRGVDKYAQLYLDLPRFRRDSYEAFRSDNPIARYWERIKSVFRKRIDDFDSGYNPEDAIKIVGADVWGSEQNKRLPIQGIFQIPFDDVSTDVMHGMARYMHGLEKLKVLKEIHPIAQALQSNLQHGDLGPKNMSRISKIMYNNFHIMVNTEKEGAYFRSVAVNNLIDREFYGKTQKGITANNKFLNSIVNTMFRGASMSYLAVQLPSAVTNMLAQMTQVLIEGIGGEYFTPKDLALGSVDAGQALLQISHEVYKQGVNSYEVQLVNAFNAIPGRVSEGEGKLGSSAGRTVLADTVSLSWLYSPRKFMETYATLQAFYAIMNHIQVEQTINGKTQKIKYKDAFELKNGQLTLKEGIDPTWGLQGDKYKKIKNEILMIQYAMNGAYDRFGQPEMQRYLLFRMFSFLRRFITTMIVNRLAVTRHNPGMMNAKTGFYIEAIKAFYRGITSNGKYFQNLAPSEKAAFKKMFAEIGLVYLAEVLMSALFGWDPDDEDKYEKLRANSGPMPLPGVSETENPFEFGGWLGNHLLFQLMQVESQTQMWIPLPGFGLKDYTSMASMESAAVGPTIDLYGKIFDDLIMYLNDEDKAFYQRDVGPYFWQEKDNLKLWNHIGSIYGFRGVFIDPVLGIQKKEQTRTRR